MGGVADLRDGSDCGGDSAEDMECGSRGAQVGGAGETVAGGSAGCVAAADQPAFFI